MIDPTTIKWKDAMRINETRETRAAYLKRVRTALSEQQHSGAWLARKMDKSAGHVNTLLRGGYGGIPLNFVRAAAQHLGVTP